MKLNEENKGTNMEIYTSNTNNNGEKCLDAEISTPQPIDMNGQSTNLMDNIIDNDSLSPLQLNQSDSNSDVWKCSSEDDDSTVVATAASAPAKPKSNMDDEYFAGFDQTEQDQSAHLLEQKKEVEDTNPDRMDTLHDKDTDHNYCTEDPKGSDEVEEDFDPQLLCPEVRMDIDDENPILNTSSGSVNNIDSTEESDKANEDDLDLNLIGELLKFPLPNDGKEEAFEDPVTGVMVDFNLTEKEQAHRKFVFAAASVETQRVHCTACDVHLGSALSNQRDRFVHPLLKVLICKSCYSFYESGVFTRDVDGSELFCRWCGQGGNVVCCAKCPYVFCTKCIRINFGRRKVTMIRSSEAWECFVCDIGQIIFARVFCAELFAYIRLQISSASNLTGDLKSQHIFWTKDQTECCTVDPDKPKKRRLFTQLANDNKKKRTGKNSDDSDADYTPETSKKSTCYHNKNKSTNKPTTTTGIIPFLPTTTAPTTVPNGKMPIFKQNTILKQALDKLKATQGQNYLILPQKIVTDSNIPPNTTNLGNQIRIIKINQPSNTTTPLSLPPLVHYRPFVPITSATPTIESKSNEHHWFDDTILAASKINTQLSYNISLLNKTHASAKSITDLSNVYNKLQESLSTAINSLISVRKTLHSTFINDIKTKCFIPLNTAKTMNVSNTKTPIVNTGSTSTKSITNNKKDVVVEDDDDDIIIVEPPTMPVPVKKNVPGTGIKVRPLQQLQEPHPVKPIIAISEKKQEINCDKIILPSVSVRLERNSFIEELQKEHIKKGLLKMQ